MTIRVPRLRLPIILHAEPPKSPWGGGESDGDKPKGEGPRNPWSIPPSGKRGTPKPTALDEFLRRARGGGGSGGGPRLPTGAEARSLWAIGIGVVVLAWIVFTSFHPIGPQQRGVVTYFGSYGGTLDPGVRLTLPAPIANVTKIDVQNIRVDNFPEDGGENLVLTGDQNIIDLAYSVRWNIKSPEDYVFQIADPHETVRATAEAAMREVVANVTLDQAITSGRGMIEQQVQDRMQHVLDGYNSGIQVQGIAIKQAGPPEQVNDAFKDVSAAQQDATSARNQAQTYAQRKIALAQGEAAAFDAYYQQYKLAPEVTRRRMYYETMEDVLSRTDKTIVEVPGIAPLLQLKGGRPLPEPSPTPQAGGQP